MSTTTTNAPAGTEAFNTTTTSDSVAELLDDIEKFVRRFVVMSEAQATFTALWVAHTHCMFDPDPDGPGTTFRTTPYFWITSATKESGKTTLLRVLRALSAKPLMSADISTAALSRVVQMVHPTLLLDEMDATFRGDKERGEAIRGVLNSGYEYDGVRTVCDKQTHEVRMLPTFCPKAFASIGALWDTVAGRSIPVRLQRMLSTDEVEWYDRDVVDPEAQVLQVKLAGWIEANEPHLRGARPESDLDRRTADIWRPLLAVADLAGGDWPERARQAARELSTGKTTDDDDLSVRLLYDIRTVFTESQVQRYKTADLIAKLAEIEESPWGDWRRSGKPITPQAFSAMVRKFEILTMPVWTDGRTVKGYKAEQFHGAWNRYLDPPVQEGVREVGEVSSGSSTQAASNPCIPPNPTTATNGHHALSGMADVTDVSDLGASQGPGGRDGNMPTDDSDPNDPVDTNGQENPAYIPLASGGWPYRRPVWNEETAEFEFEAVSK